MLRSFFIVIIIVLFLSFSGCSNAVLTEPSSVLQTDFSNTASEQLINVDATPTATATAMPTPEPTPTPTPTPQDGRITIADGFYYMPLSEDIKDYITGSSYPTEPQDDITYDSLNYIHVMHYNFEGEILSGELIMPADLAEEVTQIFYQLYLAEYPMTSIILIDEFGGSTGDNASMSANNTSAFNYRLVAGTDKLSNHALGRAIDINPMMNPYFKGSHVSPENGEAYADRSEFSLGMIDEDDLCYRLFTAYGWEWGGAWHSSRDYQHFEKE